MARGYIRFSGDIDFSCNNFRKLAFKFANANKWMTFFDEQDAYNCRIDACKLGKFYSALYVEFKYLDELEGETVVDVLNNRGFCSTDLYVFRTTEVNECGIRIPTYYTDIELFERK